MDNKIKHLELIQGIIKRQTVNSFFLKGWSVILVSALFALAASGADSNKSFVLLAYFPSIAFWVLDGFYLREERRFRKLYDYVRLKDSSQIDFSMHTTPVNKEVGSWVAVMFSRTLLIFHGAIIATITIVIRYI